MHKLLMARVLPEHIHLRCVLVAAEGLTRLLHPQAELLDPPLQAGHQLKASLQP